MHNEPAILKERLKLLIGDRKVRAALFYTFNFDPKFFENYVMPLLVPEQQFINNSIANNILWRKLYKDGKIPPITVYYDQYGKSPDSAPMLDYHLVAVNMPSVGKNKGNFHPKHSFILIEGASSDSLIVITGSNNITQGGWCENVECISEYVLENKVNYPDTLVKALRSFIYNTQQNFALKQNNIAEGLIIKYLSKIGYTGHKGIVYYNSFQESFYKFLQGNIFDIDPTINEIEIISPYFKPDTTLIKHLQNHDLEIKIEMPVMGDYCLVKEKIYNDYKSAGVRWYEASDPVRTVHSKVYRFYGEKKVYTIIGSVNFTGPGWAGVPEIKNTVYNIESALLYIEANANSKKLLRKEILNRPLKFIGLENDLENKFEERINSPDIEFVIDWATQTIKWTKVKEVCRLYLTEDCQISLNNGKDVFIKNLPHSKEILDSIVRNPIFKVIETLPTEERIHYYYPNQIRFDQKPIEYRFSAGDIIEVWELLGTGDELLSEWITNRVEILAEFAEDESGRLVNEISESKNLLNEMARHLFGLIQLERFLFREQIWKYTVAQKTGHFHNLRYYLIHDNVDTLTSYLKDIEKMHIDKKLPGGYYWLLLMIIKEKIYKCKDLTGIIKSFAPLDADKKELKTAIEKNIASLETSLSILESTIDIQPKKLSWAKTLFEL